MEETVIKRQLNPWTWQDRFGFSQAWKIEGARSMLFMSGQGGISPDSQLVSTSEDVFESQVRQAFENLSTILEQAGGSLSDIVKLTVYLTDMSRLRDYSRVKADYIKGDQPASTAVGVTGLAIPGMLIEVEAIAAL
jgi:enamine deaminase RidA (YjgF/YER057c/UK114 family)